MGGLLSVHEAELYIEHGSETPQDIVTGVTDMAKISVGASLRTSKADAATMFWKIVVNPGSTLGITASGYAFVVRSNDERPVRRRTLDPRLYAQSLPLVRLMMIVQGTIISRGLSSRKIFFIHPFIFSFLHSFNPALHFAHL